MDSYSVSYVYHTRHSWMRAAAIGKAATGVEAVEAAKEAGYLTVAIELTDNAVPLFEVDLGPAVCLVLGHEDRGVHKNTLSIVDRVAFLPQLGKVGSLNVAQAGTAALYETARQRWMAPDA